MCGPVRACDWPLATCLAACATTVAGFEMLSIVTGLGVAFRGMALLFTMLNPQYRRDAGLINADECPSAGMPIYMSYVTYHHAAATATPFRGCLHGREAHAIAVQAHKSHFRAVRTCRSPAGPANSVCHSVAALMSDVHARQALGRRCAARAAAVETQSMPCLRHRTYPTKAPYFPSCRCNPGCFS